MTSRFETGRGEGKTLFTSKYLNFVNVYDLCKRQKILKRAISTLVPLTSFLTFPPLRSPLHCLPYGRVGICAPRPYNSLQILLPLTHWIYLLPCVTDEKKMHLNIAYVFSLAGQGIALLTKPVLQVISPTRSLLCNQPAFVLICHLPGDRTRRGSKSIWTSGNTF